LGRVRVGEGEARCAAQAYASPEAAVLTKVFALLVDDYLNEVAYDAELAGLSFSIRSTTSGFLVSFYGRAPAPPCPQPGAWPVQGLFLRALPDMRSFCMACSRLSVGRVVH